MKQKFKIGILDDDSSKVTQIMSKLIFGMADASPEKKLKYDNFEFEPYEIKVRSDIQSMINEVFEQKLDCILVDYKLSSYEIVDFTGIEFAKYLEDTLYDFPIFILTSYEDDLFANEIYNAYQVFDFDRYLSEPSERIELNFKIVEQILKSIKQKEQWEYEIAQLLPLAGTSQEIDSRIMELDTKLEKSINGKYSIPEKVKKDLSTNKLNELLAKLDKILDKE
ncbi:response regulator [Lacrimispora brassicae]